MNHLYTKVAFLNSVGDGLSKIAPNKRQNAAHGTGNGVPKHLFFPLCPSILPPILIINSRRAFTIMCSITVKLSEYVSGLKSIFGQQWHFNCVWKKYATNLNAAVYYYCCTQPMTTGRLLSEPG
jgi:hypothetical protein